MSLLTIFIVLAVLGLIFGFWGGPHFGYGWGWSPLGVILVILLIVWLMGGLH